MYSGLKGCASMANGDARHVVLMQLNGYIMENSDLLSMASIISPAQRELQHPSEAQQRLLPPSIVDIVQPREAGAPPEAASSLPQSCSPTQPPSSILYLARGGRERERDRGRERERERERERGLRD